MKQVLFAAILMASFAAAAQAQTGQTVWNAPKAACEAVKAEQNAPNQMSPGMKALNSAASTGDDKVAKAALNIYCNPPKVISPTPAPSTKAGTGRAQ